jgi:hypothetical protein
MSVISTLNHQHYVTNEPTHLHIKSCMDEILELGEVLGVESLPHLIVIYIIIIA